MIICTLSIPIDDGGTGLSFVSIIDLTQKQIKEDFEKYDTLEQVIPNCSTENIPHYMPSVQKNPNE